MQLSYGSSVVTVDGENLGSLKELVVDPRHRIVTHLVVQRGLFFSHDRLISVEHVSHADENQIELAVDARTLDEASAEFDREQYLDLEDEEFRNRYGVGGAIWRRPVGEFTGAGLNSIVPPGIGPIPPEPEVAIPSDEVGLRHGAQVSTVDQVDIGVVKELITDDHDRITHLVIDEGNLFTESKLIPIDWVRGIKENQVVLGVPLAIVERI